MHTLSVFYHLLSHLLTMCFPLLLHVGLFKMLDIRRTCAHTHTRTFTVWTCESNTAK
jgi:hypothetical protein